MAEIKIEKKKPVWPWVIVILVILGIIAYLASTTKDKDNGKDDFMDDVRDEQVLEPTDRQIDHDSAYDAKNSSSVYDQFEAFDQSIRDSTRIAVDSSYTKIAFSNLAKAVVRKADTNNLEDSKALSDLRNFSVLMTGTSSPTTNMENFKNFKTACDKVATVLEAVQVKSFPGLKQEAESLKESASKISASTAMNKQQGNIYAFLKKSKNLLKSMNP